MAARATGHIRVIDRKGGPVLYAKLKLPDGREPQRALGRLWTKRSKPPQGYLTPGQAQARLTAILAGDDETLAVKPEREVVTFGRAVDEWLRYVQDDKQRARSTVRDYRNTARARLLPALGADTPVDAITTQDVDELREALLAHVSRRTAQKVLVILHGVLTRARRKGWVAVNVAETAEKVNLTTTGEFNVLEPEQVASIARHAAGTMGALFTVAAFTGLRCPGELTALRWGSVDFANRILHVSRNYVLGAEGTTKGKRVRSVPLSDQALIALDEVSRRAHFTGPGDLVFCTETGGRLSGDRVRDEFYSALGRAGLGHLRAKPDPIIPYDLRHTFGTLAVRTAPLSDLHQ